MTDDIKLPPLPPFHIVPRVEPVDYPEVAQVLIDYARAAILADREARQQDKLDAARYRWLRDREIPEWLDLWHQNPDRIDAAIDAAMQRTSGGGHG